MEYTGPERRKSARANSRFVVSYRILGESDNIDMSQTKNLSVGGMLLTTNKKFEPGTNLALEIRLPFVFKPINIVGKVLECREVTENLIYDTRLQFISVDKPYIQLINKAVDYYCRKI
jgi:uncharacterized protein with beta-barrel porin domain